MLYFLKTNININKIQKYSFINRFILIGILIILLIIFHFPRHITNDQLKENIYEPFIPGNDEKYQSKYYNKSKYKLKHPRYNFQEKYNNRKLFKINYSFLPYLQIKTNLSYEQNAIYIFNSTGMLNITKLDFYYFRKTDEIDNKMLNHIHISMSLDKNYSDLSLISIASVLNTSSLNTYIHFHILGLNFGLDEIKNIINLKKINNKVDFLFYNAKQVEYDFERGKGEYRGFGVYGKILSPQIVNNTNKILILDSGDILCQKDLSEIYFYDIKNNYFGWILENCAGNYLKYSFDKFMTNNFHPNAGVFLVNIRLFRKDELYKKAVFLGKSYYRLICPIQDILITIANYRFQFFPLNFNIYLYDKNKKSKIEKKKKTSIDIWLEDQKYSPYKYTKEEIYDAISDPVILHFYKGKLQEKRECNKYVLQWLEYAKISGKYEDLKLKYPNPFNCLKYLN